MWGRIGSGSLFKAFCLWVLSFKDSIEIAPSKIYLLHTDWIAGSSSSSRTFPVNTRLIRSLGFSIKPLFKCLPRSVSAQRQAHKASRVLCGAHVRHLSLPKR